MSFCDIKNKTETWRLHLYNGILIAIYYNIHELDMHYTLSDSDIQIFVRFTMWNVSTLLI